MWCGCEIGCGCGVGVRLGVCEVWVGDGCG